MVLARPRHAAATCHVEDEKKVIIIKKECWDNLHVHIASYNNSSTTAALDSSAAGFACLGAAGQGGPAGELYAGNTRADGFGAGRRLPEVLLGDADLLASWAPVTLRGWIPASSASCADLIPASGSIPWTSAWISRCLRAGRACLDRLSPDSWTRLLGWIAAGELDARAWRDGLASWTGDARVDLFQPASWMDRFLPPSCRRGGDVGDNPELNDLNFKLSIADEFPTG